MPGQSWSFLEDIEENDEEYEDQETLIKSNYYEDVNPLSDLDTLYPNFQEQHISHDFGTEYDHPPMAIQQISPDMAVDSSRRYSLVQSLNLDIPENGDLIRHHVYRLPATRSQDIIHYPGSLNEVEADSADASRRGSNIFRKINPLKKKK